MFLSKNQEQLAILRHGISLLHLWCTSQRIETPSQVTDKIRDISQHLCGADIFAADFNFPNIRLKSIFSDIYLPPDAIPEARSLSAVPLSQYKIPFYDSPASDNWRAEAAKEIRQYYERIKENPIALLILLEKYGSFIPIGFNENYSSISLYEHIKFLCCLANAGSGDRPYLLVSADFSGIQDFIYTISSKGALKSLRARSFFLELLAFHITYEILEAAEAVPANIVYSGGGGFSLLLANKEEVNKSLQLLKKKCNKWFLDEYQGRVYLGMRWMELSLEEVLAPQLRRTWSRVARLLEEDKRLKFRGELPELLNEVTEPKLDSNEECQICHRDDLNKSEMKNITDPSTTETISTCPLCYRLYHWGNDLTNYRYVIRESLPPRDTHAIQLPSFKGYAYYHISPKKEKVESFEIRLVKNSWDIVEYADGKSNLFTCADHVTRLSDLRPLQAGENDSTADFESLANESTGKKLIGALRMDADNLGLAFTRGISDDRFDLPHYSALSRQLGLFFTIYMNLLCQAKNENPLDLLSKKPYQKHGRDVTIIYSGGDDLFIIGAWDQIVELACDIAQSFAHYGGHNPDISISGGVLLTKPDFPLYQIAHLSKTAEEKAKGALNQCKMTDCTKSYKGCALYRGEGDKCTRKNAALLFYVPARVMRKERKEKEQRGEKNTEIATALQWQAIQEKVVPMMELFCKLARPGISNHLEIEGLSRSFIRQLFELIDVWENEKEMYLPLMHYTVTRLSKALSGRLAQMGDDDSLERLLSSSYLLRPDLMEVFWVPLTWVDLLMREER